MEEKQDRVTIGFYVLQDTAIHKKSTGERISKIHTVWDAKEEGRDYKEAPSLLIVKKSEEAAFGQIDNIKKLADELTAAATKAGRQPPEIVLSVYVVPAWKKSELAYESRKGKFEVDDNDHTPSSFEHENYRIAREVFIRNYKEKINEKFRHSGVHSPRVEDFYETLKEQKKDDKDATLKEAEKVFLQGLTNNGANADMVKTHAIIREENQARRHLQLDSNTIIHDIGGLYEQTFGKQEQQDGLNASLYDSKVGYVSAHNKIVYTTPAGTMAKELRTGHEAFCRNNGNNAAVKAGNSIYSKNFVVSLAKVGLTTSKEIEVDEVPKTIYLANLNAPQYQMTSSVATAVNGSWLTTTPSETKPDPSDEAVKNALKGIKIDLASPGKGEWDHACFLNAVKKYAGRIDIHTISKNESEIIEQEKASHLQLIKISNSPKETELMKAFVEKAAQNSNPDVLKSVLKEFPDTKRAKECFEKIFECSKEDYLANKGPVKQTILKM